MKKLCIMSTKLIFLLTLVSISLFLISTCTAQGTTVKAQPSNNAPSIGETFTVDITVANVQNLHGLDVSLNWDPTILKVLSTTSFLGIESKPSGVLHNPVTVVEEGASLAGRYTLVAYSGELAASFSGSGKIATLTFNVTKAGQTELTLITELADKPAPGEVADLINHTDISGSVNAQIPELPTILALLIFMILATASLFFVKKQINKNRAPLTSMTYF